MTKIPGFLRGPSFKRVTFLSIKLLSSILSHRRLDTGPTVNRFLFRIGFIGRVNRLGLPYLTVRRIRSAVHGQSLFFILTASISPCSLCLTLFPRSWPFLRSRSFVRVIRGSRAAICHAQIQEFAPPTANAHRPKKTSAHGALFLINARQECMCVTSVLILFEFFVSSRITLTRVTDTTRADLRADRGN